MIEELEPLSIVTAASDGDAHAVRWLVETGADVETPDDDGDTPLLAAAKNGHAEIVRYLLDRGADSRCTNKYGDTVLMGAARSGSLAVAEILLVVNANINLGNNAGQTPLMFAAAKGGRAMVQFLIQHGASIEAQDKNSFNTLFYAVNFGQVNTTKYLVENYAKNLLGGWIDLNHIVSAAVNAPESNCAVRLAEECASLVLGAIGTRGASIRVTVTDDLGSCEVPLLTWVIGNKKFSKGVVEAAQRAGADPNGDFIFRDTRLGPMLFAAVALDRPDAVEALIEAGAATDASWDNIGSPLVLAVSLKREACILVLLRARASLDLGALSNDGRQVLMAIAMESETFRAQLGISSAPFELTTVIAKHMYQLETLLALRIDNAEIMEYFAAQSAKRDGPLGHREKIEAHLSLLRTLLAAAPSKATRYAEQIRNIVVAAHVGSAKRIEDEKRGLRRAINEVARLIARNLDWYEDSDEATGFAEYLLACTDYKDAVRVGREGAVSQGVPADIGVSFEKRCQRILAEGGFAVSTTPTSGDQGADLIGTKDGLTYVVQCKAWSGSVGNSAVQEAISARSFYVADFAAVASDGRFTTSARELAARSQVVLIRAEGLKVLDAICRAMV